VGGAVDGQSAESVRINIHSHEIRLLAQATAPLRRQISQDGGVITLPASGRDQVLLPVEAALLVQLANELPQKFPPIVDAKGSAAPADIEFGFLNGELNLFQIRPFLDNVDTRAIAYLRAMDATSGSQAMVPIDLDQLP
ncbi:MAG: PEP/pyruvate-binding domain-containing protein, partial [Gammaproteobacteria bacterium]